MKNKILLFIIGIISLTLVGCSSSSNIAKEMNKVVDDSVSKWEEKGYAHTFSLSDIQSDLDGKYIIIASGDKEFTKAVSNTSYTEKVSDYDGNTYTYTRMMEKDMNVNYCLVLNKDNNKYYNIKITYKTINLNGVEKEYPYFENEKEI